jgi:hypothetical protein
MRNSFKILVGKSERKGPLEDITSSLKNKMRGTEWIRVAQGRDRWRAVPWSSVIWWKGAQQTRL